MNWFANMLAGDNVAFWIILAGAISNASCALLGCYLVLRRMSMLGDAISHAVLPGIVVAFLFAGSYSLPAMFIGAMLVGMLTAFLTQTLHTFGKVPEDASMGVVFTSLFALGVLLLTNLARKIDLDPGCVLYGLIEMLPFDTVRILGLDVPRDLGPLLVALVATLLFVGLFWKELKIASFDPALATALGISAVAVHYGLMAMTALVTVAAFKAVGSVLVVAMLIVPAATAHLLSDRLGWMMVWAVLLGILASVFGYWGAELLNTSVAGMMAVVAGGEFGLAVLLAPRHGLLSKVLNNYALAMRIVGEDVVAMLYRSEELASRLPARGQMTWRRCVRAVGGGLVAWLAVPQLRRRGDVTFGPGWSVQLTDQGRLGAQSLVRSHRLWEAFLVEHFQLPLDHLHAPAERVEHYIGPELQERLAAQLQTPAIDPHGRKIPPPISHP
jgi:manganese/zinc/iron transport system permease protein